MAMEMAMATLIGTFCFVKKIVRNRVEKDRVCFSKNTFFSSNTFFGSIHENALIKFVGP